MPNKVGGSDHLTGERKVVIAGMFGFSGEGPEGTTCRQCKHVERVGRLQGRCLKAWHAMPWLKAARLYDLRAASCQAFEEGPEPAEHRLTTADFRTRH